MRKAVSLLCALLFVGCLAAPLVIQAGSEDNGISLHYAYTGSYVPAYAHLYGGVLDSFVDVTLSNASQESVTVLVGAWVEGVSAVAEEPVTLAPGESHTAQLNPQYLPGGSSMAGSGTLRVRVTRLDDGEKTILHDDSTGISVYPEHTFLWEPGMDAADNHRLLGAWITPQSPAVAGLLRRAADYLDTASVRTGYDGTPRDENAFVFTRLEGVWGSISEQEITSEPLEGSLGEGGGLFIRTPGMVLGERAGNYLEKALLYASACEALELETAVVIAPEAALVGVRMDTENALYYFVDASLLGQAAFDRACASGERAWPELLEHLRNGDAGYLWLDVGEMRWIGVQSMPAALRDAAGGEPLPGVDIHYIYRQELITALYHLYGSVLDDFLRVYLTNNLETPITVLVESGIEGYTYTQASTVTLSPGEKYAVRQNPRLQTDAIDALNSMRPGSLSLRVTRLMEGEDELLIHDSVEVSVYSRRDFIWVYGFSPQEEFALYAAWVTPNDPSVEELIRRAVEYTDAGIMMNGYQDLNDDNGTVWDRLQALWRAHEEYDLIYVSTMVAFSEGYNQRIRTPYDVLSQKSGNCIETTLLYASLAEALDLEAAIVQIPGHAYAGVRLDEENAQYYFIETTLIGRASFADAVASGNAKWEETLPHLEAGDDGYFWINVKDAREMGILPMPWR